MCPLGEDDICLQCRNRYRHGTGHNLFCSWECASKYHYLHKWKMPNHGAGNPYVRYQTLHTVEERRRNWGKRWFWGKERLGRK